VLAPSSRSKARLGGSRDVLLLAEEDNKQKGDFIKMEELAV